MVWDPALYMKFGDQRTRPALDLLAHVSLVDPSCGIDLGCGPGNSTAVLATRWPQMALTGLDSDPAMLERARSLGLSVRWQQADIAQWRAAEPCQLIFSNAVLQWLDGHEALFPHLMVQLEEGGVLAVQMPTNHSAPSHRVMHDLAHQGEWFGDLGPVLRENPVQRPEDYHRILAPHAQAIDIWETTYLMRLTGKDPVLSWIRSTALRPLLDALEPKRAAMFEAALAGKLRQAYPPERDGATLFPFRRMFIVATR
jgi:trans-aconitate 2-methyltransferase